MINNFVIASNPFFDAYIQSDLLGKLIFVGLIALSICSWIILVHKIWLTRLALKSSREFQQAFQLQKFSPLMIDCEAVPSKFKLNPFQTVYSILKKTTLELLNKNRHFSRQVKEGKGGETPFLSPADIEFVEAHLLSGISSQTKYLEKNLFILATVVSLGPFLGLLGTVWGILTTFSDMTSQAGGNSHQAVLGGLSLALATTVLGLVDAIPALIGYNYLKNAIRDFEMDMQGFAHEILSSVEMQYRKVDVE